MKLKKILLIMIVALITLSCARGASRTTTTSSSPCTNNCEEVVLTDLNEAYTTTWSNFGGSTGASYSISSGTGVGVMLPTADSNPTISELNTGGIYSPLVVYSGNTKNQYIFALEIDGTVMSLKKYIYSDLGLTPDTNEFNIPTFTADSNNREAHQIALSIEDGKDPYIYVSHSRGVNKINKLGQNVATLNTTTSAYRILIDSGNVYFHTDSEIYRTDKNLLNPTSISFSGSVTFGGLRSLPMVLSNNVLYFQGKVGSNDALFSVNTEFSGTVDSENISNGGVISSLIKYGEGILYVVKFDNTLLLKPRDYMVSTLLFGQVSKQICRDIQGDMGFGKFNSDTWTSACNYFSGGFISYDGGEFSYEARSPMDYMDSFRSSIDPGHLPYKNEFERAYRDLDSSIEVGVGVKTTKIFTYTSGVAPSTEMVGQDADAANPTSKDRYFGNRSRQPLNPFESVDDNTPINEVKEENLGKVSTTTEVKYSRRSGLAGANFKLSGKYIIGDDSRTPIIVDGNSIVLPSTTDDFFTYEGRFYGYEAERNEVVTTPENLLLNNDSENSKYTALHMLYKVDQSLSSIERIGQIKPEDYGGARGTNTLGTLESIESVNSSSLVTIGDDGNVDTQKVGTHITKYSNFKLNTPKLNLFNRGNGNPMEIRDLFSVPTFLKTAKFLVYDSTTEAYIGVFNFTDTTRTFARNTAYINEILNQTNAFFNLKYTKQMFTPLASDTDPLRIAGVTNLNEQSNKLKFLKLRGSNNLQINSLLKNRSTEVQFISGSGGVDKTHRVLFKSAEANNVEVKSIAVGNKVVFMVGEDQGQFSIYYLK